MSRKKTLEERVSNFLVDEKGCHVWQGAKCRDGYGIVKHFGRGIGAHRAVYELKIKQRLPKEIYVCHHCDNPSCINVEHLFIGTQKKNMQDMVLKKRSFNQKKTHCRRGHEFTEKNTAYERNGMKRVCRKCAVIRSKKWHNKNK